MRWFNFTFVFFFATIGTLLIVQTNAVSILTLFNSINSNENTEYNHQSLEDRSNDTMKDEIEDLHIITGNVNSGSISIRSYSTVGNIERNRVVGNPKKQKVIGTENDINNNNIQGPPPHDQVAKMARFIVTHSNWTSIATISSRDPIIGYPFANIISVSDGTYGNGTGSIYMYMTPFDLSVIDLTKDNRASLTMSLAQMGHYCALHHYDPEDPRCAHIMLSGEIVELSKNSSEYSTGLQAIFSRHPVMSTWPKDHGWFVTKLNIQNILVQDYFAGPRAVTVNDYYKVIL